MEERLDWAIEYVQSKINRIKSDYLLDSTMDLDDVLKLLNKVKG